MTDDSVSHILNSRIYRALFETPEMRNIFSDRSLVQTWLDVETALARAEADVGVIATPAAGEIARRAQANSIDLEILKQQTEIGGYPILPFVRMLAAQCANGAGEYLEWAHMQLLPGGVVCMP